MAFPHSVNVCTRRHTPLWLVGVFLGFCTGTAVHASSPRDELLRFVPESTALCVVFQDLRTHWTTLQHSPFAEQFRASSLGKALADAEEVKKLDRLEKMLEKQLGLTWVQLRDDIFGESVIFAYRPGPPDKPEQDRSLLLLRSRNAKTLADLIERFNETQKKAGKLTELETLEYNGLKYYRRVEMQETSYYHLRGPVLVLSGQEEMLKQALDCDRGLAESSEPPLVRQFKQLEADRTLMTLWLNPRAFDAAVEARAIKARPVDAEVQKTVAACWKALDGLALSLHLDRDLSLSLAVSGRLEAMPPATRKLLAQAGRQGDLGRLFPADPLFALAARLDLAALIDSVSEFLPGKSQQSLQDDLNRTFGAALGKNFVKEILPYIGPDMGLIVSAPSLQEKGWTPHTLVALRVGAGPGPDPVDQAMLAGVQVLAQFAVFSHNAAQQVRPIALKKVMLDGREIRYLGGEAFPPGFQPAFALHSGYLLLASSPEVIRRFSPTVAPGDPASEDSIALLRISFKAWRAYFNDNQRREGLIQAMIAKNELTAAEAGDKIERLQRGIEMFDRIELRQKTSKNLGVLTLSLRPAQPFKK